MRYKLKQLVALASMFCLLFGLVGGIYRTHDNTSKRIALIREHGGDVLSLDRGGWQSIVRPEIILEVDLANVYNLNQDVINAAFALRPTNRLVFPSGCEVASFDLQGLRDLSTLCSVELLPSKYITSVPRSIQHLIIVDSEETPEGFLTDEQESHLKQLTCLTWLAIRLDSSELVVVRHLKSLEVLDLQGSKLGDSDCSEIAALPRLRALLLNGASIDDKAISSIADCRTLKTLTISNTEVTAKSVPELMSMKKLETLHIANTSIRSQDFPKAWPELNELYLSLTQIVAESEAMFRERMRGTEIFVWRSPNRAGQNGDDS